MCRLLATIGPPRPLLSLVTGTSHSLEVQSYQPKLMDEALLNADGFGVAWYVDGHTSAARYRSVLPIWSDENLRGFGAQVEAGHVLAYVRSATPGIGAGMANTQPFTHGRLTFMHNGYLKGFRDGPMRRIQRSLSDASFEAIRGSSDSEHLFALFLDALNDTGTIEKALPETLTRAAAAMEGAPSLTTLIVSDGETIHALRGSLHGASSPSLFFRSEGATHVIASEPLDEKEWTAFPPNGQARLTSEGVQVDW